MSADHEPRSAKGEPNRGKRPADERLTWDEVEQYLAGELPAAAAEKIGIHLHTHPETAESLDVLRGATILPIPEPSDNDPEQSWARLAARLPAVETEAAPWSSAHGHSVASVPEAVSKRARHLGDWPLRHRVPWMRHAVAMFGILIGGVFVYRSVLSRSVPPLARTYTTAIGQQSTLLLPNGVVVTLAPQTTLQVIPQAVQLVGEASFAVPKHDRHPFTVVAGRTSIRVLGTTFDVKHEAHHADVQVAVIEGKVAVTTATPRHSALVVAAGTVAHLTDSTAKVTAVDDARDYTAWTHGTLVFHGTTVGEMLHTVGTWYGYEFRCADSSLTRDRFTGSFRVTSEARVLHALQQALQVTMTFNGRVVTLSPRHNSPIDSFPRQRRETLTSTPTEIGR